MIKKEQDEIVNTPNEIVSFAEFFKTDAMSREEYLTWTVGQGEYCLTRVLAICSKNSRGPELRNATLEEST